MEGNGLSSKEELALVFLVEVLLKQGPDTRWDSCRAQAQDLAEAVAANSAWLVCSAAGTWRQVYMPGVQGD